MKEKNTLMKVLTGILLTTMCLSSASALRLNEVMYNPPGSDSNREWIEVYNDETLAVDMSEIRLVENDVNHIISAYGQSTLEPGEFALITQSPADLLADYPEYSGLLFISSFSLSNSGETLALKNSSFDIISELAYTDAFANGNNRTVEWVGGELSESIVDGGTPGEQNSQAAEVPEFSGVTITLGALIALAGVFVIRKRH